MRQLDTFRFRLKIMVEDIESYLIVLMWDMSMWDVLLQICNPPKLKAMNYSYTLLVQIKNIVKGY